LLSLLKTYNYVTVTKKTVTKRYCYEKTVTKRYSYEKKSCLSKKKKYNGNGVITNALLPNSG